jgi:hypothetical protein
MSCFFQLIFAIVFVLSASLASAMYATDTNKAAISAVISLLSFSVIVALRRKGKKAKNNRTRTNKVPKYIGDAIIQAHSDLQGETFKCAQCRRQHPIKAAASIDVRNWEEEVEPDDDDLEGETKTVIKHRYNGLICSKCARIVSGLRSDSHSYYNIPDEMRAGND